MKLLSWNVNGIRSILGKGFLDYVAKEAPDILCLQEIKAQKEQVTMDLPGYHTYWNSAEKKGYSGTLILSLKKPITIQNGLGIPAHDTEGRVITAEYDPYYIVTVYTPNAQHELKRLSYRMQWDQEFLKYVHRLEQKKPVILCGDFNVAHTEIDLTNPTQNRRNPGFTDEERNGFSQLLTSGFVDSFRAFDATPYKYTWWPYKFMCRKRNIGWRIDYVVASTKLKNKMEKAFIQPHIMGSDHCPVGIEINE